jgi:hypothetical protein
MKKLILLTSTKGKTKKEISREVLKSWRKYKKANKK